MVLKRALSHTRGACALVGFLLVHNQHATFNASLHFHIHVGTPCHLLTQLGASGIYGLAATIHGLSVRVHVRNAADLCGAVCTLRSTKSLEH